MIASPIRSAMAITATGSCTPQITVIGARLNSKSVRDQRLKPFLRSLPGPSIKTDEAARPVPGR